MLDAGSSLDNPLLQVSTVAFQTMSVTLLCTAVETVVLNEVHKLFHTNLFNNNIVLVVADGLFGSEHTDELFTSPPSSFSVPNKPYGFCGHRAPCLLTKLLTYS